MYREEPKKEKLIQGYVCDNYSRFYHDETGLMVKPYPDYKQSFENIIKAFNTIKGCYPEITMDKTYQSPDNCFYYEFYVKNTDYKKELEEYLKYLVREQGYLSEKISCITNELLEKKE